MGDFNGLAGRRKRLALTSSRILALSIAAALAACGSVPQPKSASNRKTKEYFAESEYGVKASPRVTDKRTRLPRGGGRDQIGKPYKVKGNWYRPREEPGYKATGAASWYGDAFHGRLTANGEVYDMTHLTAAHPTMPLPSYARVTNLNNKSSVIVRVNDRGPFARGRVIDLSKRAAQLLDYKHNGVAKVQVEYLGRAPLHGQDDSYLMASYRPGGARQAPGSRPDLNEGLPTGVMIAMNGSTPTRRAQARPPAHFPSAPVPQAQPRPVMVASAVPASAPFDYSRVEAAIGSHPSGMMSGQAQSMVAAGDPVLPAYGPIPLDRPGMGFTVQPPTRLAMSYADQRIASAAAFAPFEGAADAGQIAEAWKKANPAAIPARAAPESGDFVLAGTFSSQGEAQALVGRLSPLGRVAVVNEGDAFVVELRPASRAGALDPLLRAAWDGGAADAMIVRMD